MAGGPKLTRILPAGPRAAWTVGWWFWVGSARQYAAASAVVRSDVARLAEVNDIVTRSISGHLTPRMQELYSTVNEDEQRDGIARVISLVGRLQVGSMVVSAPSEVGSMRSPKEGQKQKAG